MSLAVHHGALMDEVYRHQRHFYDATRKYYLLGRDRLIDGLAPPQGGSVLEIGCGTGRNLCRIQKRFRDAKCFGIDISDAMLETARMNGRRQGLALNLARADATGFTCSELFGIPAADRVVMSYTLSMIPDWRGALACGLAATAPGGRLAIVDFGSGSGLPAVFVRGLDWWLNRFHVTRRLELGTALTDLAVAEAVRLSMRELYHGYAVQAELSRGLISQSEPSALRRANRPANVPARDWGVAKWYGSGF